MRACRAGPGAACGDEGIADTSRYRWTVIVDPWCRARTPRQGAQRRRDRGAHGRDLHPIQRRRCRDRDLLAIDIVALSFQVGEPEPFSKPSQDIHRWPIVGRNIPHSRILTAQVTRGDLVDARIVVDRVQRLSQPRDVLDLGGNEDVEILGTHDAVKIHGNPADHDVVNLARLERRKHSHDGIPLHLVQAYATCSSLGG